MTLLTILLAILVLLELVRLVMVVIQIKKNGISENKNRYIMSVYQKLEYWLDREDERDDV